MSRCTTRPSRPGGGDDGYTFGVLWQLFGADPVLDEDEFTHLLETGEPPARAVESSTPSAEESS